MDDRLVIEHWRTPEQARAVGWESLLGGEDFFLTPEWMRVLQDSSGAEHGYVTVRSGGRLLAGLALVRATEKSPWALGRTDLLLAHCDREGMDGASALVGELGEVGRLVPSMMLGGRHLGRTRLLLAEGAPAEAAEAALAGAEEAARAAGCVSLCLPYADDSDGTVRSVLDGSGYAHCVSGEFASLTLHGSGFADYAMSLPARRSRRVRAERRRVEASDVRIDLGPLRLEDVPRLAALETELFAKYGMSGWDPRRSEAVLEAAHRWLGERALVARAVLEGEIVGFGLVLAHGEDWFAHRAGFDYAAQGKLPLYYELLYYTLADHAPEHGVRRVHYGIGSVDAKVSRGCRLSRQYLYVKEL
ncbi:GNAT family N-acetyltransferase [Streptomyces sp. HSG2]|uniref:GNAT family N-acetyltransferase n=1 Tax=Streptomyces sp. HSG2 TaxID=2797167 RepID=UPI001908FE35|nr:GNAT family N-acetyltransferase [Streptomyces sp. HSG2]